MKNWLNLQELEKKQVQVQYIMIMLQHQLFGGFVIVKTTPLKVVKIQPPNDLVLCVAFLRIEGSCNRKPKHQEELFQKKLKF